MAKPKFTIQPVQSTRPVGEVDRELMTKSLDDGVYPLSMAKEIRLDRLRPDPNQPRHSFNEARLKELAASIREQGILQPIVVEYVDEEDYFRIIHGERRWRASMMIGLQTIPAIIHKVDDSNRLARQLIENIQREDLNDVDRALALKQLKLNLGSPSWEVVAQKVGISKRRILQLVDTTKLPKSVQQDIRAGKLTEKHGRALKKLPPEKQEEFAQVFREQELSGDDSLEIVKLLGATPELPIAEAIAQVKQATAKPEKPKESIPPVAADQPAEPQPNGAPKGADLPAATAAGAPATPETAALAALAAVEDVSGILDQIGAAHYDAVRLEDILRQVIERAETILNRLAGTFEVPPLPEDRAAPMMAAEDGWD